MTISGTIAAEPRPHSGGGFDEYLGSGSQRYLSEGHRRVDLELTNLSRDELGRYSSLASLRYPEDWSMKNGEQRTPHLSTIDAIRVATRMRELLAASVVPMLSEFGLERSLSVRAGAKPWEGLDSVPVSCEVTVVDDGRVVRLRHTIGSLKVESEWVRRGGVTANEQKSPYASKVADVQLDRGQYVSCLYSRDSGSTEPVSFLEVLTLTAQMSQVALYEGKQANRARSGNMWMRRASFVRHAWSGPTQQRVQLLLRNRKQLVVNNGMIETAEVLAEDVFGVHVTAALAAGE